MPKAAFSAATYSCSRLKKGRLDLSPQGWASRCAASDALRAFFLFFSVFFCVGEASVRRAGGGGGGCSRSFREEAVMEKRRKETVEGETTRAKGRAAS